MKKYSIFVTIIALAELIYILSGSVGSSQPRTNTAPLRAAAVSAYQPTATPRPRPTATMLPFAASKPKATATPKPKATVKPKAAATAKPATKTYILNKSTKVFHVPSCSSVKQMKESNKKTYTGTRQQVINMGYRPCQKCGP